MRFFENLRDRFLSWGEYKGLTKRHDEDGSYYAEDYDDEYEDEEIVEDERPIKKVGRETSVETSFVKKWKSDNAVVDVHKIYDFRVESERRASETRISVRLVRPNSIEDCRKISSSIRSGDIVMVNLEGVSFAQRIVDFLAGVADALEGDIAKASEKVFILAPMGINLSNELMDEIASGDGLHFVFRK